MMGIAVKRVSGIGLLFDKSRTNAASGPLQGIHFQPPVDIISSDL